MIPNPAKEKIRVDIIMETELMVLGEIAIQIDTVKTDTAKTCTNVFETDSIFRIENSINDSLDINKTQTPYNNDSASISPKIDLINNKKWLHVYPNPTSDNAIIEWKNEDESTIEIVDLNGKLIWSAQIKGPRTVFNTSHLSAGNYLVKITSKITGKSASAQLSVYHE